MKKLKIVTIGGGSSYTPELIDGFIKRYDELPVTDYYLLDIEEGKEKLEIVGKLAQRMVKEAGIPMNIHLSLNREEALKDADFVTTQLRVGFLDARINDEKIPLKYGVLGQETTGPGGFMKAQRTIPVLMDICRDMEKYCPDAWLINFTNPAGIVTEAITRHSNIKSIGICSGANSMLMDIAKAYEVEKKDVYARIMGLNHLIFADQIFIKGEDNTDDFMAKLAQGSASNSLKNIPDIGFSSRFAKALHMYPISYLKYFFLTREMVEAAQKDASTKGTRGEQTREIEHRLFELYQDPHLSHKPKELEKRGGAWYSDTACSIISSIYNDKKEIHVVNTVNNGATPDLPDHVTLETNAMIDRNGAHPLAYGRLPVKIRGLIQSVKAYEELAVEAAITGDYSTALMALTINPLVPSATLAEKILDEYLEVNQRYLPQYQHKG
jgi:6-phospho-beta-glucosidase